jgi:ribosomal protein L23
MSIQNLHNTIIAPIVTEKSLASQAKGVHSFWVGATANKHQIGAAFKAVFGTQAISVRTMTLPGKVKSDPKKRLSIQKPDRKRAFITVAKDSKIELLNLNSK